MFRLVLAAGVLMVFGLFKRHQPGGEIAYFGLSDWWLASFTEEEREAIRRRYQPVGGDGRALDDGKLTAVTGSPTAFLTGLAGWFTSEETRTIAYRMLQKADELDDETSPILARHFAMQTRCQVFYRWRDTDPGALEAAIDACERGIAISREAAQAFRELWGMIPAHHCFKQLAIVEEKRGNVDRAISLCLMAEAHGWNGGWSDRIERLEKKRRRLLG